MRRRRRKKKRRRGRKKKDMKTQSLELISMCPQRRMLSHPLNFYMSIRFLVLTMATLFPVSKITFICSTFSCYGYHLTLASSPVGHQKCIPAWWVARKGIHGSTTGFYRSVSFATHFMAWSNLPVFGLVISTLLCLSLVWLIEKLITWYFPSIICLACAFILLYMLMTLSSLVMTPIDFSVPSLTSTFTFKSSTWVHSGTSLTSKLSNSHQTHFLLLVKIYWKS